MWSPIRLSFWLGSRGWDPCRFSICNELEFRQVFRQFFTEIIAEKYIIAAVVLRDAKSQNNTDQFRFKLYFNSQNIKKTDMNVEQTNEGDGTEDASTIIAAKPYVLHVYLLKIHSPPTTSALACYSHFPMCDLLILQ